MQKLQGNGHPNSGKIGKEDGRGYLLVWVEVVPRIALFDKYYDKNVSELVYSGISLKRSE